MRVCMVSTYPPRRCGIATYSQDLRDGLLRVDRSAEISVAALGSAPPDQRYPDEVALEIDRDDRDAYLAAARMLDRGGFDAVSLQHEFGIFGGDDGSHVVALLEALETPVVTTLHTVLHDPSEGQRSVLAAVARASQRLIVHSRTARDLLTSVYDLGATETAVIPHGVPDVAFEPTDRAKATLGFAGRRMLLTFGLVSRNKGIEVVLKALPRVVAAHPDVLYVVLGATHPEVARHEGESYRVELQQLSTELGIDKHVEFHDRYVSLAELTEYLAACDVYVTPYRSREQIVSGTLAYAIGMGKAVLSTPYPYAQELLADGRGRLVDFGDVDGMAEQLSAYLDDELGRERTRRLAYAYGRAMTWPEVAARHHELFARLPQRVTRHAVMPARATRVEPVPAPSAGHLLRLTDDTGVLQHASWHTPARRHGYASDDAARALLVAVRHRAVTGADDLDRVARTSLAYLSDAQRPDGRFRNLMSFDRRWLDEVGSEDTLGQALWGLATAAVSGADAALRDHAEALLRRAIEPAEALVHARAQAYAICGLTTVLDACPDDRQALAATRVLAGRLAAAADAVWAPDWRWIGDELTYANAKLPHALLRAGHALADERLVERGFDTLDFLIEQTLTDGVFDPIGNQGWYVRGGPRARFGQQPIEAGYSIEVGVDAAAMTSGARAQRYLAYASAALEWFSGRNRLQTSLYDPTSGACADGLDEDGINRNAGAESTIVCLLGLLAAAEAGLQQQRVPPVASSA